MIALFIVSALVQFTEQRLATLPEGEVDEVAFRPDGGAVAYIQAGAVYVGREKVASGEKAKWIDWSPDGRITSFVRSGQKWRLYVGSEPGEEFDQIWSPSFAAGGKGMAYRARNGKRLVMVVDGRKSPEFDEISMVHGYDDTGRILYYAGRSGEQWTVVVGEKASGPFEKVGLQTVSADGSACAVNVVKDGKGRVLLHDRLGEPFEEISMQALSPDGRVLAFAAREDGKMVVVFGDRKIKTEFRTLQNLAVSDDGKHVAYTGGSPLRCVLFVDDRRTEVKGGFMARELAFRPASAEVAFEVWIKDRRAVWWAGEPGESFELVRRMTWSPAGEMVYVGHRPSKKEVLVVGKTPGPEVDAVDDFRFDSKGNHLALYQKDGRNYLRIGDRERPVDEFHTRRLRFSADGKRVGFGAVVGRELWWRTFDLP